MSGLLNAYNVQPLRMQQKINDFLFCLRRNKTLFPQKDAYKVDNVKQTIYYINITIFTLTSSVNVRVKFQNNSTVVTY